MSSVRTNLRTALRSCILEMTTSSYNYTYLDVNDPPKNMEQFTRYPAVNILYGTERRLNDRVVANDPIIDILLPVQFDIFLHDVNDTSLAQDKTIADFQKYFGSNYYIRPSAGERAAFNCLWLSSTLWGTEREVPNCGVSIDFEVWYSIQLSNPNLMV